MSDAALTGTDAVAAVALGERSVSDIAAESLGRVRDLDEAICAFRALDEQAVISRAKELSDRAAGPLRGLVVGVKDVMDTADLPTRYGSPLFQDHCPTVDAAVVSKLRRSGAIVLGKTETTEFAMFHPTRTHNPVDLDRTPGGSSSGSAAAVAAGMVPVALGTQTAGSVIRPAAYCGVYGFKPARGWTSTAGIWCLSEQLDTVGLFARTVADLRMTYGQLRDVVAGTPARAAGTATGRQRTRPRPPPRTIGELRCAVLTGDEWGSVDGDASDALAATAVRLETAGCMVSEMVMPPQWLRLPDHHVTVMAVEVAKNLRARLGDQVAQISESARGIVQRGDGTPALDYLEALDARGEAIELLGSLGVAADIVLAPSALGVAPEGLDFTGDPVMCRPWTLLGLPAANVPAHCRADGLPVGVQAIGLGFDDVEYLDHLALIEAALSETEQRP